jgi:hypothetical protein
MVLSLLIFLQSCRASFLTQFDARRPYNASFFNGDLTILPGFFIVIGPLYIECNAIYGCMARRTRLAVKQWVALAN